MWDLETNSMFPLWTVLKHVSFLPFNGTTVLFINKLTPIVVIG